MSRLPRARLAAVALVCLHASARADEVVLDLPTALDRATRTTAATLAAHGEVAVASAGLVGTDRWITADPELEVEAGPRLADRATTGLRVQLGQALPPPGLGAARRALARAGVVVAEADAEVITREVRHQTALAFLAALAAERATALADDALALATRADGVAQARRRAGVLDDVGAALATAARGRAGADVAAAAAERAAAIGALAALTGVGPDDTVVVRGDLATPRDLTLAAVETTATARPELRALAAAEAVAAAEARLATAERRPSLGLWLGYERDDDAQLVQGGVRLALPLWDRGQQGRAIALAHRARARAEAEARRRTDRRALRDAFAVYQHARDALATFEREVAPALDTAEQALGRGLDAGTVVLADYLVARQELAAGRHAQLALELALARAHVELQLAAGGAP